MDNVQERINNVIQTYSAMPLSRETLRSAIVSIGTSFIGVSEVGTTNTGFWVDKFNRDIGVFGVAWCVAFVQYDYKYSSYIWNVPDILPYNTASTQNLYEWAEKNDLVFTDYTLLKPADIVVWRNGMTKLGHTGFVSKINPDNPTIVSTIEGNTNSTFSRDGGDVCEHTANILRYGEIGVTKTIERYTRGFISFDKLWDFSEIIGTIASAGFKASDKLISGVIASANQ